MIGKIRELAVEQRIHRRVLALTKQSRPKVVSPHLHTAFVLADYGRQKIGMALVIGRFLEPVIACQFMLPIGAKPAQCIHDRTPWSSNEPGFWRNMVKNRLSCAES